MTWALDEASEFVTKHKAAADRFGFMLGVYGSVLERDDARDLDLFAIAWRHGADAHGLVDEIVSTTGARIADTAEGLMGALAFALQLPNGQVVDIQFRGQPRLCPACGRAGI